MALVAMLDNLGLDRGVITLLGFSVTFQAITVVILPQLAKLGCEVSALQ